MGADCIAPEYDAYAAAVHPEADATTLALAAASGDRDALADFIRLTQAEVWRFVAHLAGSARADDLTQETYLRMLSALPRFEGRSSARWWLMSIARRVVVDQHRHDSCRPRTVTITDDHIESVLADPRGDVSDLLAALDPARREALVLTQVMGYSYADAAAIAGCPIGTIRSRVARGRADLIALRSQVATGV
jgi:RNA polymerase sigma-70 factor (ECF subfamily)